MQENADCRKLIVPMIYEVFSIVTLKSNSKNKKGVGNPIHFNYQIFPEKTEIAIQFKFMPPFNLDLKKISLELLHRIFLDFKAASNLVPWL